MDCWLVQVGSSWRFKDPGRHMVCQLNFWGLNLNATEQFIYGARI